MEDKEKNRQENVLGMEYQTNSQMDAEAGYLIHLIRCALHNEAPKEKPQECSWESLWQMARRNNVECTISPAIQKYQGTIPEHIFGKWKNALSYNLNRFLRFEVERESILQKLNEKGIAYLPLKGILTADDYPVPGMRWMSDNDILYGYVEQDDFGQWKPRGDNKEAQEKWQKRASDTLMAVMTELGYTPEHLGGHHDVYQKPPIFNFEMHQSLVPKTNLAFAYYQNPWQKAMQSENDSCHFYFQDEDAYIFHVVHAHKHFDGSGCGIRTLVDEYVILHNKKEMDHQYISEELKKLHLENFEEQLRQAAAHAFSKSPHITEEDWKIIAYMLGCGTYGNLYSLVQNKMTKIEQRLGRANRKKSSLRFAYIKERLHVEEATMEAYFSFFYRHKALRFLLPFWRIGWGLIAHPKRLIEE